LAQKLRSLPDKAFVDYQYFDVSAEPSSFFIQPVYADGERKGWFALQCSINKINNIFMRDERLGATGEVILVNRENYMLTDSRFAPASSILRQQLSDENISSKFRERSGHKSVIDYRGSKVITSFDVCTVFGSEWLIIAKIGEDELVTDYYKQNRLQFSESLLLSLKTAKIKACPPFTTDKEIIEVDMDEYRRAAEGEVLYTHGVSSCSAVLITYPGKFSYLAHVSPFDILYGKKRTDLLGNMLRSVSEFEIFPSEKQWISFAIIAPKDQVIENIIDRLIREGYFLSQITVLSNEKVQYANIYSDYSENRSVIEWKNFDANENLTCSDISDFKTAGEYARDIMYLER
jgi:hypothetical protein